MSTLTLRNETKMNWLVLFGWRGSDVWQFIDLALCVAADRLLTGLYTLITCWLISPPPLYILLQSPAKVTAQYEMPLFQSRQIQNGCHPEDREVLGQMERKIIEFTALWCVIPGGKLLLEMSAEFVGVQSCVKSQWGKIQHGLREMKIKNNRIILVINYAVF